MTADGSTLQVAATARKEGRGPQHLPDPCAVVIFGASGDLTRRKLAPALLHLCRDGLLPDGISVVGFSRNPDDAPAFRRHLREALGEGSAEGWDRFQPRLHFVRGSYDDADSYRRLGKCLADLDRGAGSGGNRLYYLATPPAAFAGILQSLRAGKLLYLPDTSPWSRVIIEKPFGRDLASARELNGLVAEVLDESQTYRIDHYLGKETVQNILVFRFGNSIFEHLWNRRYVEYVEITAAERIGIEGRGAFYDRAGALRDMVQSHLLQVLALCTMEPPLSFRADDIRDQRVQLLRSLAALYPADVADAAVFAQYRGYRDEPHVAADSRTPSYVALRLTIDNWRWQGVPFYLRTGKSLRARATEVTFHFRPIPLCLFGEKEVCQAVQPNDLTLRIQPDEGIALRFVAKVPGDGLDLSPVDMDFRYAEAFRTPSRDAYERLLLDCMRGDPTLFARREEVERAWEFVTPILETWEAGQAAPEEYQQGSDGPAAADRLLAREGHRWLPIA